MIDKHLQEQTLNYLQIIIDFLEKKGGVKAEMYLDSQDLESYEQIKIIVTNAMNGTDEINGIYRLNDVRRFLTSIGNHYAAEHDPIADYIFSVLIDLEPYTFSRNYNYVNKDESEGIQEIGKKYRLPVEMKQEISSFIGDKSIGGRKRKTHRCKNNKRKRRKTKRRKAKYSRK